MMGGCAELAVTKQQDDLARAAIGFAILRHRTVLLDPIETLTSQGRERPTSWQNPHPGAALITSTSCWVEFSSRLARWRTIARAIGPA